MERACAGTKIDNVPGDTGAYWVTPLLLVCKVIRVSGLVLVACTAGFGVVQSSLLAWHSATARHAKQWAPAVAACSGCTIV